MFRADKPIESSKEDILGRQYFAKSLGEAILSVKEKNTIVIGLYGEWGSGKTSIINLAVEEIKDVSATNKQKKEPIIIRFNPWNFSDQNQLIAQFFKHLSLVLRRKDYANEAKEAGEVLETYSRFFEPLTLVPQWGLIAGIIGGVFKTIGGASKAYGEAKSKDLSEIRSELNRLLAKQPHKIIVIIDDIDRLNNLEIRQIFQLVKSLGDFPNLVYLLAFDKNVVVNALSKIQEGNGFYYLEKIVQVPFDIPTISKEEVEQFLFKQLDELIKDTPEEKWDKIYWGNIYHSGLRHFFNNIRDVNRYINALRLSFGMVKGEVNPIDFLAITSIQVFMPEIYYGIRQNKDLFSGVLGDYYGSQERDQTKKQCDHILAKKPESISAEALFDFLKRLFPKLESLYGNMGYSSSFLERWRRELRVCSPDIFEIYFKLSIPRGDLSQKELEEAFRLGNSREKFSEILLKINGEGKIIKFLERLEDYTAEHIPEEHIQNIVSALMDVGDAFPEDRTFWGIDSSMRVLRIQHQLGNRYKTQEERFLILKRAIEDAQDSIYTIVNEVSVRDQEHGRYFSAQKDAEPEDRCTINATQLTELEKIATNKIRLWAKDGRLQKHRKLAGILFSWKYWTSNREVQEFVQEMIKTDAGLVDFLVGFLSKSLSHGMSDYAVRENWRISVKNLGVFSEVKDIVPRVRALLAADNFQKLDGKEKLAVKTFVDTVDGKIKDV